MCDNIFNIILTFKIVNNLTCSVAFKFEVTIVFSVFHAELAFDLVFFVELTFVVDCVRTKVGFFELNFLMVPGSMHFELSNFILSRTIDLSIFRDFKPKL